MFEMDTGITFKKTGAEIKTAVQERIKDLEQRLEKRNVALEELLNDKKRLRSFLVRDPANPWPIQGLQAQFEIPSEDHQEILELCRRAFVIEKELANLRMILAHLQDDQEFKLTFQEMASYGFGKVSA
jgi:hypothetical protein